MYIGFSGSVIVIIVASPTVGVVITIVAVGIFLYMIAAKLNATASTGIGSAAQGGTQLIAVGNGGNNFGIPNQGYTRSVRNVSKGIFLFVCLFFFLPIWYPLLHGPLMF